MSLSLYDATVPSLLQVLTALSETLDKAQAHCVAAGLPETELTQARLAADMWDFAEQIRAMVLFSSVSVAGALAGHMAPDFTPPPHDLAQLKARLEAAIGALKAVSKGDLDATLGKDAIVTTPGGQLDYRAEDLLFSFALPNFYFHAATAYDILRMKGLPLVKRDYLGITRKKMVAA